MIFTKTRLALHSHKMKQKTIRFAPWNQLNQKWLQWWRKQSPNRQDRLALLGPLLSVLLFLGAILMAFAYLQYEETGREQESVRRDVEYAQQRLRLRHNPRFQRQSPLRVHHVLPHQRLRRILDLIGPVIAQIRRQQYQRHQLLVGRLL